jgi:hypothetical protein
VANCDALVAFWDGSSPGTSMTINFMRKTLKPMLIIKYNPKTEEKVNWKSIEIINLSTHQQSESFSTPSSSSSSTTSGSNKRKVEIIPVTKEELDRIKRMKQTRIEFQPKNSEDVLKLKRLKKKEKKIKLKQSKIDTKHFFPQKSKDSSSEDDNEDEDNEKSDRNYSAENDEEKEENDNNENLWEKQE